LAAVITSLEAPPAQGDLSHRLSELLRIGAALSKERDINRLLEAILVAAKEITNADGGTLYRMTEDRQALRFEIMRNDTLGITMGGTSGEDIPFYPVNLYDRDGAPIFSMVAAYTVHHDCSVNIADAYTEAGFDFSGTKNFDKKTGYRSTSFLTVPMKNHEDEIIGVLQLINAKNRASGEVVPFSDDDQKLAESLASQAAIALTNRLLINHLEALFESFIQMINAAIDDKSPYTGGHCERVPMLTMLLAEAVNNCKVGPLHDFSMSDARPLRTENRRSAARLRQGDHAGARGRQGHQAADHLRPDRPDRHPLRSTATRCRNRAAAGAGLGGADSGPAAGHR
jgi:hypothetical protein